MFMYVYIYSCVWVPFGRHLHTHIQPLSPSRGQITVSTRSARADKQFVWEAEADSSSYVIREEVEEANLLTRGTSITLHLKVILCPMPNAHCLGSSM